MNRNTDYQWENRQRSKYMVVEIISVGTELLMGNIVNTNAQHIAQKLAHMGLDAYYQTVVGDNPERLRAAYSSGIFPWSAFEGERELYWWAPRPRFVLRPDEVHISHSMRQLRHSGRYRVTFNTAFARVVDGCRTAQDRHRQQGAWLSEPLMASFCQLHDEGLAESVEVWEGDALVGGLYGVRHPRLFCGDSMFSLAPSASKMALIALAERMAAEGDGIIDCQLPTDHLRSMGAREMDYEEYREYLPPHEHYIDRSAG